ncbi:MAG TPA: phosphodiester glycosidase family protein, partial [Thermoanaerobaculia bacterium]|nr:phosphodiester glycosidase family protein [Thermoanaerobaculia bacterium]
MGWVRPLLIAVFLTQPVVVAGAVSAPYRVGSTATLAPGVVHERGTMTTTTAGKQAVNVARVDLAQPVLRLESVLSNDQILGLEPVTQQANRRNREAHRAVVAINGDQFDTKQAPSGMQIASGELIAYGPKPRPAFGVTADRKALIDVAGITGSVCRPDGVCMTIARVNQARTMGEGAGELVLFTSRFADTTGTDDSGNEVVLSGVTLPLPSRGSFSGIVKKVRTKAGATPIGANEVVLSGSGTGAKFLQFLADGTRLAITFTISTRWENVTDAVSGPNILVRDGAVTIEPYTHGYADVASPRTAVGVDAKGNVLIFVIDGRQPGYSMGVTLDELAELMAKEGVVDALNLDGGGSTTFAARTPGTDGVTMFNRASEGYERPVSNALVVFSTAPTGPLASILIRPDSASVLLGSRIDYDALGVDAAQNAVKLPQAPRWESTAGTIDASGRFTAGLAGDGTVKAISERISATTPVSVVQNLASLEIA